MLNSQKLCFAIKGTVVVRWIKGLQELFKILIFEYEKLKFLLKKVSYQGDVSMLLFGKLS